MGNGCLSSFFLHPAGDTEILKTVIELEKTQGKYCYGFATNVLKRHINELLQHLIYKKIIV